MSTYVEKEIDQSRIQTESMDSPHLGEMTPVAAKLARKVRAKILGKRGAKVRNGKLDRPSRPG